MQTRISLNLEQLSVASFETQSTPPVEKGKEAALTCLNTGCPPYHCCV